MIVVSSFDQHDVVAVFLLSSKTILDSILFLHDLVSFLVNLLHPIVQKFLIILKLLYRFTNTHLYLGPGEQYSTLKGFPKYAGRMAILIILSNR